jgi:hypothetical protein
MKESQRYKYERDNDHLRELRGCVGIITRVKERTSERDADDLGVALQLIEIVVRNMDTRLIGIKNAED